MRVKIKKLTKEAVIPKYAKPGDAGMDLTATSVKYNEEYGTIEYGTGLAFEIPEGHVGLIFPRSSNKKKDVYLTNHVGVVDSGYRGEVKFAFKPEYSEWKSGGTEYLDENLENGNFIFYGKDVEHRWRKRSLNVYGVGDRVGQIIILPYPSIEFEEVQQLSETERGEGGYGSTGK